MREGEERDAVMFQNADGRSGTVLGVVYEAWLTVRPREPKCNQPTCPPAAWPVEEAALEWPLPE